MPLRIRFLVGWCMIMYMYMYMHAHVHVDLHVEGHVQDCHQMSCLSSHSLHTVVMYIQWLPKSIRIHFYTPVYTTQEQT